MFNATSNRQILSRDELSSIRTVIEFGASPELLESIRALGIDLENDVFSDLPTQCPSGHLLCVTGYYKSVLCFHKSRTRTRSCLDYADPACCVHSEGRIEILPLAYRYSTQDKLEQFVPLQTNLFAVSLNEAPYSVQVHNVQTCDVVSTMDCQSSSRVKGLDSPPGHPVIVSGGSKVCVSDFRTGETLQELLDCPEQTESVLCRSDSVFVAGKQDDGRGFVGQYDLQTGTLVNRYRGHRDVVQSLDMASESTDYHHRPNSDCSSHGSVLFTAGRDSVVMMWDVRTSKPIARWGVQAYSLCVDSSEKKLLIGRRAGRVTILDLRTGMTLRTVHALENRCLTTIVTDIAIFGDGEYASCSFTGSLSTWLLSGKVTGTWCTDTADPFCHNRIGFLDARS